MQHQSSALKEKILEAMVVDYKSALEKNFRLAQKFIKITKDGKVDVVVKDKVTVQEQILLYFIGKAYAKEAGLAKDDHVGDKELMAELGIPKGTLLPTLKEAREKKIIEPVLCERYRHHKISMWCIEKVLNAIEKKVEKGGK